MSTYDTDVVAWATRQAQLLRERRFDELDVENIAEEIEDVAKSEQRDLARRVTAVLASLLKWRLQEPERSNEIWGLRPEVAGQRRIVRRLLVNAPALALTLTDAYWQAQMWSDAVVQTLRETEAVMPDLELPEHCPWPLEDVLSDGWFPDEKEGV